MHGFMAFSHRLTALTLPLQQLFALVLRVWLFEVFFSSGLTKIQSWSSTLALFEYEYSVPVIPPELAAWLATAGELVLPVLLVVGLLSRFSALGLFVLNAVAAISYPDISLAGVQQHIMWGVMLAYLSVHGGGVLSVDKLLAKRWPQQD